MIIISIPILYVHVHSAENNNNNTHTSVCVKRYVRDNYREPDNGEMYL